MSYSKDGLTVTYKYDANGLRTQKTVNGVVYNYGYENGKLVYERKGNEYEVIYRYDADGNLFTVNRCIFSSGYTSLLYAVNNTRGDVVALYKGGGGRYSTYTYDSWGKPIVEATGMSAENSIRYRGYVYDQETGLYYLQSRYYDPETGRFLNADDVDYIGYSGEQLSYNAFAYCENNAVNYMDFDGTSAISFILNFYKKLLNMLTKTPKLLNEVINSIEIRNEERKYNGKKAKNKYQISVNFELYKAFWLKINRSVNCKKIIDSVAEYALYKFKDEIGRDFLLDKDCVSNEIYLHLKGYMWSIGEKANCPIRFKFYMRYIRKSNDIKSDIKIACFEANMAEADMFFFPEEADSLTGFDYYNGVLEKYKRKITDPYWNGRNRSQTSLREDWLYEDLF